MQRELVERARSGDREAFSVLAGTSISRLYAVANLILRDGDRAQDAVQEALTAAWRLWSPKCSTPNPSRSDACVISDVIRTRPTRACCPADANRSNRSRSTVYANRRPLAGKVWNTEATA